VGTDIELDSARRVSEAFTPLTKTLGEVAAGVHDTNVDESAFGMLCGLIIAPWFQSLENGAEQSVTDSSTMTTTGADAFKAVAGGFGECDSELCKILQQAVGP